MSQPQFALPQLPFPITDKGDKSSQVFRQYLAAVDTFLRAIGIGVGSALLGPGQGITLTAVAVPTNANAAAAGVPLGGLYCSTADPAIVYIRTV
jgi:hypothetical protein